MFDLNVPQSKGPWLKWLEVLEVAGKLKVLGSVRLDAPAQLLRQEGRWLALTFTGQLILVDQMRPLEELSESFVLGPGW